MSLRNPPNAYRTPWWIGFEALRYALEVAPYRLIFRSTTGTFRATTL
jgi:hypothetical protein